MYQRILFDTTQRIFEEAAFAMVDPPNESPEAESVLDVGPILSASVEFSGPFSGRLAVTTPERLAMTLAANMLGVDEDDPDAQKKTLDALGEILNMICGNLLPVIASTKVEFRINAPKELPVEKFYQLIGEHLPEFSTTVKMFVEGCETELALLLEDETIDWD